MRKMFEYSYDALNRPIFRNADAFGYNARSEVTNAIIAGGSDWYEYDEIGNSTNWTANNLNQYTPFTYDLDGNLLSNGLFTYTYDAANRLSTVSSNGVLLVTNFYDAKSRRVQKVTPDATTTFFYDDWNLIEERIAYTNGTTSTIRYYWGKDLTGDLQGAGGVGGLLYLTVGDSVYVPFYDNNGNITRYLDATGNTVALYTYDAFGNLLSRSGPLVDLFRHRFSTKYLDPETGLYYYGYRFYAPSLMRWLNRDPIEEEGGVNLYAFCSNNTLSNCDALGMWATQWFSLGKPRLVYRKQRKDTIASLAEKAGLEASEVSSWAKGGKTRWNASSGVALSESNFSDYCFVSVPNVWIDADLLCGGGFKDMIINIGGTIGSFWGTDLFTSGNHKIITVRSTDQLLQAINHIQGTSMGDVGLRAWVSRWVHLRSRRQWSDDSNETNRCNQGRKIQTTRNQHDAMFQLDRDRH